MVIFMPSSAQSGSLDQAPESLTVPAFWLLSSICFAGAVQKRISENSREMDAAQRWR